MNQLHVVEADSWCIRNISYAYMLCLFFDVSSFYAVSEFFTHEYICCCWVILHSMACVSYILNFIQFKEELLYKLIICFDRNERGRSHAAFCKLDKYYFAHFVWFVNQMCQYLLKFGQEEKKAKYIEYSYNFWCKYHGIIRVVFRRVWWSKTSFLRPWMYPKCFLMGLNGVCSFLSCHGPWDEMIKCKSGTITISITITLHINFSLFSTQKQKESSPSG